MRESLGEGWEVEEGIKGSDGKLFSRYWFNGKVTIRHELGGKTAKQFGGYSLIRKDLNNILSWLSHIEKFMKNIPPIPAELGESRRRGDLGTNQIISGLLVAIVATYGKLFTDAEGRKVKLEKRIISDERQTLLHEQLMVWRHNYVAHSGSDSPERSVVFIALTDPNENSVSYKLQCEISQPNSLIKTDYELLGELVRVLLAYTEQKRKKLMKEITIRELNQAEINVILDLYRKGGRKFAPR